MPRASRSKPDAGKVYVAWQSFALGHDTIQKGARRRGDDEAVRQAFAYWAEDGTPDAEMRHELDSLNPPNLDNPLETEVTLAADPAATPEIRTLAKDVRAAVGVGRAKTVRTLKRGTPFLAGDELPRLRPDLFENGGKS